MKYAVLTNDVMKIYLRPSIHPKKAYIVEADSPKKAMNIVKKALSGQDVNVFDAVEIGELPS
jgi:hypothetical protein